MVSGVHITIFERGRINFLGFGVSYNWIKNPRYLRKGDFKESTALTIPFSVRLGKKENDAPTYLTISCAYNMETAVRGYGLFAGFSVPKINAVVATKKRKALSSKRATSVKQ